MDSHTIIALAFIAMLAVNYVAGAVRDVLVATLTSWSARSATPPALPTTSSGG